MKDLQLSLIGEWFEMTKVRIKPEDYRKFNPFWCNRFLLYQGKPRTVKWWSYMEIYEGCFFRKAILELIETGQITFIEFASNIMTLGYPKKGDPERTIKLEHKGISIGEGKPEWGAEPGKIYFIIKHGEIIK